MKNNQLTHLCQLCPDRFQLLPLHITLRALRSEREGRFRALCLFEVFAVDHIVVVRQDRPASQCA